MQRIPTLAFLYSSLSPSSSLLLTVSRSTRGSALAVALSCPSNISDPFGPLHFFSYAAPASPLCRQGTQVSHHFPDKSALYSFILLHSDGFLTRGTRIRTKPGDASCSIGETTAGWIRRRHPRSPPVCVPNIIFTWSAFTDTQRFSVCRSILPWSIVLNLSISNFSTSDRVTKNNVRLRAADINGRWSVYTKRS